jgi:hypothetical protein
MNLYPRNIFQASVAVFLAALIAGAAAQSLRRKPHQLRATSLAEVTIDSHGVTTARLIPITILAEGSFHDASIYKNEPQPMVLGRGVVYEVQKTGQPVGFVTVGNSVKDKGLGWTALGKWQPVSPPSAKASATPTPSNSADDRPVLHRPGGSGSTPPSASPSVTPTPTPGNGDSDRPVLHRPESAATPTPGPSGTPSPGATSSPAASQAEPPSQPDADRPTLRRRTPGSSEDTSTSRELPPASPSPAGKPTPPPVALTNTTGTQTLVAVSDEQSSDSRSYQFLWKPGEEAPIDAKLRRLALAQLAGQVSESSLTNVIIRSFDLDLSNDAVMVISAEAPPVAAPQAAKGAQSAAAGKAPVAAGALRYVTVIARVDFEGALHKLASSVTDASRLDVAPRLELIDAVDVDGDGFGELLFREYGFDEKSFVIYQIGRSTVTKLFEGASQSTK